MLVGLGRAGTLAMDALGRRPDIELVAAIDLHPGKARARFPDGLSIRTSLVDLPNAEIAIVSTPTPSHRTVCLELIERAPGLSLILCEKPGAMSAQHLEELVGSARDRGVELRVLLHYGFGSEVLWLAEHLSELGEVSSFSAAFEDPYGAALAERTATLVSSWVDSGINALTVLARLLEPTAVIDSRSPSAESSRTELSFRCGSSSGTGVVTTSWRASMARKSTCLTLVDDAVLDVDHLAGTVTHNGSTLYRAPPGDARVMRYRTMIAAHLDDAPTLLDEATAMRLHALLAAAIEAQRSTRGA